MKKKLVMIAAFCLSMCVVSVRANESGDLFTTQGYLSEVTVSPFNVGDQQISVHVGSFGYVFTSVNGENLEVPNIKHKVTCDKTKTWIYYPDCYEREWETSGYRAGEDGNYTVKLKKPLAEGDKVTLSFADDGNFYFGQLTFESQKSQNERLQKEREAEEKQYAEELFKRSIEEETNKTWYQRWGDSIQDQWWNLKSWWQG
ncbi:hypothetical protein ScFU97_10590 [Streptococcus canis]|uniref:hypothetical protein n=1 Tax=Streptococcus canis TaxID=1329 RepID=UPI0010CA2559|nr:hypothetical protein [Streptococcus canis]GFG47720.1 hypothetical protein ScFU97_10590 [Streptococcus canis]VTR80882.1 phage protein [Streptococcus canis]